MRSRLSTPEEVKLVVTKIVETIKDDSQRGDKFDFDYSEDDLLDDYMSLKESCHCMTIETPYGYKLINVIDLSDDDETINKTCETFIVFEGDKIYKHEGDFIAKDLTEEKFIENEKLSNEIFRLECDVNRAKFMLLNNLDSITEQNGFIAIYQKACTKLNEFLDKQMEKKSLK